MLLRMFPTCLPFFLSAYTRLPRKVFLAIPPARLPSYSRTSHRRTRHEPWRGNSRFTRAACGSDRTRWLSISVLAAKDLASLTHALAFPGFPRIRAMNRSSNCRPVAVIDRDRRDIRIWRSTVIPVAQRGIPPDVPRLPERFEFAMVEKLFK